MKIRNKQQNNMAQLVIFEKKFASPKCQKKVCFGGNLPVPHRYQMAAPQRKCTSLDKKNPEYYSFEQLHSPPSHDHFCY